MCAMRFPFGKRRDDAPDDSSPEPSRPSPDEVTDEDLVREIADRYLPDDVRERWLRLLRPAIRLVPVTGTQQQVGRLGGLPTLPDDVPWPSWEGHGPLSYIGELDCDQLATFGLELPAPSSGRLLFFYFDGSYDDHETTVGTWDAATLQGARAVHLPADVTAPPREAPDGITVYPEARMAGRTIMTAPGWDHPDLRDAFMEPGQDHRSFMEHPVAGDDFTEALDERHTGPRHQVGGYATPVQGPVEDEVAHAALHNEVAWTDPRLRAEAERWELLFQVDSDDDLDMMWGDVGTLYWLARTGDPANDDPTAISFTWQCC